MDNIIGTRICERLGKLNMSQRELAKACQMTEVTISRYISGARIPNGKRLLKIAEVLQVDTDFFLKDEKKDIKALGTYQGVFKAELQRLVSQKCKEINHYITGCDSPFSYTQIREVQESLNGIEEVLGIKKEYKW